jgi:hypothetical protein
VEEKHEEGNGLIHHLRTKNKCILLKSTGTDNKTDRLISIEMYTEALCEVLKYKTHILINY